MNKSIKKLIDKLYELEKIETNRVISLMKVEDMFAYYKSNDFDESYRISEKILEDKSIVEGLDEIKFIKYLLRIFEMPLSDKQKYNFLFRDFNNLSKYLLKIGMNDKDITNILFSIIDDNIKTGILREDKINVTVSPSDLLKIDFSSIKADVTNKIKNLIIDDTALATLLNCESKDLTKEEKEIKSTIEEYIYKENLKFSLHLQEQIKIIKECYFDKNYDYNIDDINKIVTALQKLGVKSEVCNIVRKYLNNKYKNRSKNKEMKINFESIKTENNTVTESEFKCLKKEINKVYNFYSMDLKKENLSFDEVIDIASKTIRIEAATDIQLKTFLYSALPNYKQFIYSCLNNDPLKFYETYYDMLLFYKDKEELNEIDSIYEYYKNSTKEINEEELNYLKEWLKISIRSTLNSIHDFYSYILSLAKEKSKTLVYKSL